MIHPTDEEIDALVDEALEHGQPPTPMLAVPIWSCVDDDGEPRPVAGFDPRTP